MMRRFCAFSQRGKTAQNAVRSVLLPCAHMDAAPHAAFRQLTVAARFAATGFPQTAVHCRAASGATTPVAAKPCGRTQVKLDELKEKVKAGKIDYVDYFYGAPHQLPDGTQVSIDRCKKCGCTIDEHAPGELLPAVSATQVVPGLYDAISGAKPTAIAGTSALDVMYSKAGWPAELSEKTCFVRKEVVSIVADFLKHPEQCIVIVGQPGTGKSFAGGYAVNRCLNADHKIVIYVVRDSIYTFDAESKNAFRVGRTTNAHAQRRPREIVPHPRAARA